MTLAAALTRDGGFWRSLEVVEEIGSTNAALAASAAEDAPGGAVLVAEHQVAGRGRLDRVWTSPPRAGLTVSFLLRPDVPAGDLVLGDEHRPLRGVVGRGGRERGVRGADLIDHLQRPPHGAVAGQSRLEGHPVECRAVQIRPAR